MKILLLSAISLVFMGSAYAAGPNDPEMSSVAAMNIGSVELDDGDAGVSASDAQTARDAADDLEFARLMADAPDQGDFGDSVVVDKSSVEIRVSGFGFNDE